MTQFFNALTRGLALIYALGAVFPVHATTDAWPALHDVIGVSSDDVLNVRVEPDPTSEVIGSLPHDAEGIEVIRPNEDFTWGYIALRERMGWVSLRFLAPQPEQWDGKYPEITSCYGTEPFWHLNRTDDVIKFGGLDLPEMTAPLERLSSSLGHRGRHSFVAEDLIGVLSNQLCNDGMTDLEFGWELNLIVQTGDPYLEHYVGCCSLSP